MNIKKVLLFLAFFLSSCNPIPVVSSTSTKHPTTPHFTGTPTTSPTQPPTETLIPSLTNMPTTLYAERFQKILAIDLQCPHICWSGISPGITSAEDARALLGTSELLKYETTQNDEIIVNIFFEKGLAKSIYFDLFKTPYIVIVDDVIQLLGQPDEIRIGQWSAQDCTSVAYLLYYKERKTIIEVANGGSNGPNPNDHFVFGIALNVEIDNTFFQYRHSKLYDDGLSPRQPWLGYGHFKDYLPEQSTSKHPCLTPAP